MDCSLLDMGYRGGPFTWSNHQTKERFDRSLWTAELRGLFPCSTTRHLHPSISDHSPLLVEVCAAPVTDRRKKNLFRFDRSWASHLDCQGIIQGGWQTIVQGDPIRQTAAKIKNTSMALVT